MARILLGVSGGIAAYKACEVCRLFVRGGHEVVPLLTPGAERFVTPETFRALARRGRDDEVYLHLTRTDLLVVAPAMNPRMWSHPATRANAEALRARRVAFVGPDEGETAEGELGVGRMAEPDEIVRAAEELLSGAGPLACKRVLVSAGGTREPLDAVRFLGNRSSGRMGVALAAEARRRGARVTLLGANLAVPAPAGVELVRTPSAADVEREALERAAEADVVIMAAAVADYRPAVMLPAKRPKDASGWTLELEPTTDVLSELGARRRNGQILIGFAADHGEPGLERAREKLARKGADMFVFNDVSRDDIGFDSDDNAVTIVSATGEHELPKAPKDEIAAAILGEVEALLRGDA